MGDIAQSIMESELVGQLTTAAMQRVYAFALAVLVTGLAVRIAYPLLRFLHNQTRYDELVRRMRIPGPEPTRAATIAAQRARKLNTARSYSAKTIGTIILVFLLGVGVPFASVMTVTWYGDWLFPGMPVLIDAVSREPVEAPNLTQLAGFAADLFVKGGLNDLFEVFEWEIGQLRHASDNWGYSSFILLFRVVADVFVLSLVFYAGRTLWHWRRASIHVMRHARSQSN